MSFQTLFAQVGLLEGESESLRQWLAEQSAERRLAAGETLLTPGIANSHLYLLLEGRLKILLDKTSDYLVAYLLQELGSMSG